MNKRMFFKLAQSKKSYYLLAASLLVSLGTSGAILADEAQQANEVEQSQPSAEQSQSSSENPAENSGNMEQKEAQAQQEPDDKQTEVDQTASEQQKSVEQELDAKETEQEKPAAENEVKKDQQASDFSKHETRGAVTPQANGFYQDANGNWYYVKNKQEQAKGWQTIDGKKMYFREDGSQVKGEFIYDNGGYYYFDQDTGELWTNRFIYKSGSNDHSKTFTNWYYLGMDGTPVTGYQTINGKRYYFNALGEQLKGTILGEDGKQIAADEETGEILETNGLPKANSFYQDASGKWYYYNDKQEQVTGWQTIDGKKMYFREDGSQAKGELISDNDKVYYFDQDSGEMWTNCFFQSPYLDSYYRYYYKNWYYLGADGAAVTGYQNIDGKEYYFYRNGIQAKGHVVRTEIGDDYNYYDDESGELVRNQFRRIYDLTFWLEHNPYYAGRRDLGVYMYFDANGKSVSGWQTIDGKKMYFHTFPNSPIKAPLQVRGKMLEIEGKSYYFDPDSGELWTNRTLSYEGKNYQLDQDGVATLVP